MSAHTAIKSNPSPHLCQLSSCERSDCLPRALLVTPIVFALAMILPFSKPTTVFAQSMVNETKPPTPTPLAQRGLLSRSATSGYNSKITDGAWGAGGDQAGEAPITGSVSKISDREWIAKLFNNSEDIYSVSVEVRQMNKSGKRERSDSFSVRLGAKESYERSLRATERTVDAELALQSWKNLSERSRKEQEGSEASTAGTR